jgi:tetratricopeptide (TPR) repeat protein
MYVLLSLLVVAGVAAAYLFVSERGGDIPVDPGVPGDGVVIVPPYGGEEITFVGKDPIVQQIPKEKLIEYVGELNRLKDSLAENPVDLDGWLQVGFIKKFFNNYVGARDAWEYGGVVVPMNSVSFFNLGNLYALYLKDFVKAEASYKAAIDRDPTIAQYYLGLAEFYWMFNTAKKAEAAGVIEGGLKKIPDDPELLAARKVYAL